MSFVSETREWSTARVPAWAGADRAPAALNGGSLVDNLRFEKSPFRSLAELSLAERGAAARMPTIRPSPAGPGPGSGPPPPAGVLAAVAAVSARRRAHADARVRRWQARGPPDVEGGFAATNLG
jgi:hypothetical protein